MTVMLRLFGCLILSLSLCAQAIPQTPTSQASPAKAKPSALTIAVAPTEHGVRFTAIGQADKLRLEVYNSAGEQLLDTGFRPGSLLDWSLTDAQGQALPDNTYTCVVTAHDLAGTLRVKQGNVTVQGGRAMLELPDTGALASGDKQSSAEQSLTPLTEADAPAMTIVAHTEREGLIASTRGALSFRVGNIFAGLDEEGMRLTEEGNLGIGTAKPKARLDVAGAVRARQGFMFNDGSTLNVNEKGALILTGSDGTVAPNAAGTGTQNHLAKWLETGGAGTLGDSSVTELANGFVGIGTTNPQVRLDVVDDTSSVGGFQLTNHTNGSTAQLQNRLVNNAGAFAYYGMTSSGYTQAPILSNRAFFGSFQADTVIWTQTANDILFATNGLSTATERMRIKASGNVGIGTNNPQSLLHLTGNAGTFTPFRGLTIDQSINPNSNLSGYALSVTTTSSCGPICSVTGTDFLVSSNGNVGVGTASPGTILDVRGNLTLDAGASPSLYTSSSSGEQNRYLQLINSPNSPSASGLKAGGLLVSDSYGFANPGKNDLIVKGNVGIGTATPNIAKLQVNDSSVGTAVYGNSTIATGVFGQSSVALFGGVEGDNSATSGIGVIGKANAAGGVGVYGRSDNGVGVNGISVNGFAMRADGNTYQQRDKGGWVKAMVYVLENGTISGCYNGLTGASVTGGTANTGCGFSVAHQSLGNNDIDFGFRVDDRFFSIMVGLDSGNNHNGAEFSNTNSNTALKVFTYKLEGTINTDAPFMVIVY